MKAPSVKPAKRLPEPPPLPSERTRRTTVKISIGDAVLAVKALHLVADRTEGTATRLRGLAPELHARAARLRRLAASIDAQVGGWQ